MTMKYKASWTCLLVEGILENWKFSEGNLENLRQWGYISYYPEPVVLNRGLFCTARGHLVISGDTFGCHHLGDGVSGI